MHIVIPMSGAGERFLQAGYRDPKPLIMVDNQPIIQYVVSMFSPKDRYTFVCNENHLEKTDLASVLKKIVPESTILSIKPHRQGPVSAVNQCLDHIDSEEETIVNYCDFYSYWHYQDFLNHTRDRKAAGAVVAYRGFHPHMLGTDNYAFIKDNNQWLEAIQEKKPFTDHRMAQFASNGTYYFAKGAYIKQYFPQLIAGNIEVNGEFYVSMIFNLMVRDKLPISIYEVQHMLQWGTPYDLEEYQQWSNYFAHATNLDNNSSAQVSEPSRSRIEADVCLVPMAGRGARFVDAGYQTPKPLIPISAKPMVVQACESLPKAARYLFVALKEHLDSTSLEEVLAEHFRNVSIVGLTAVTEGQAVTCQVGLKNVQPAIDRNSSLLIGACDNGMVYSKELFSDMLSDKSIDVAAFSFRNHPSSERKPKMYGWLKVTPDAERFPTIESVSVKEPISSNPRKDHAITGAFFFRHVSTFLQAFEELKRRDIRVNGEYYVDSLICTAVDFGYHCVAFEVDDYLCFGTPDDLSTFEYWQSFFHKCSWHPYRIELDPSVGSDREALERAVNDEQKQRFA